MISAFGIEHEVSKTYMGEGVWKPVTSLNVHARRAMKNAIRLRRDGNPKQIAEKPLPAAWIQNGVGRVRVTRYHGNGLFEGVDGRDNIRLISRKNAKFAKAAPKTVPDSLSVVLPGSTVRAYDNSRRHKTEAGVKNFASKLGAGGAGFIAGAALGGVAARRLKPLARATKVGLPKGKTLVISADKKAGWAQSLAGGAVGGAAGTAAGNTSLKRIRNNPRYGYKR